jgi:hypothetical protein
MSRRSYNQNSDNLLSAPSSSDIENSENYKYSKKTGILTTAYRYTFGVLSSLFKSSNLEKNLKERPYVSSRSQKGSRVSNNYSKPSYTNTTENVLDNDTYDESSYETASTPEPISTPEKSSKTTKAAAVGTALIFGLSGGFFMQLLLLIIVLAIFGINVLHYLGYGLETSGKIINATGDKVTEVATKTKDIGEVGITNALPVTKKVIKQTAIVSGEGTKGAVDITVGAVNKSVDLVGGETGTDINDTYSKYNKSQYVNKTIDLALAKQQPTKKQKPPDSDSSPKEDSYEGGWCYIGSEGGVRSCASLEEGVSCSSGEIFGNKEVCINPNLRE